MAHLTLTRLGSNQTELAVGLATLFFSYSTCVAACVAGKGFLVTDMFHSRSTSKHIAQWLAGRKATVVPQDVLNALCVLNTP